jgi:excisionase family DNA binding protein
MQLNLFAETLARIEAKIDAQSIEPMSLPQAAAYLNISKSTLYGLTSRSEIPHYKPNGKKLVFLKADLDKYLLRNRVSTREEVEGEC